MPSHDNLNPTQREAVEFLQGPMLVLAGAGSGKTRVVTYRIAHLLAQQIEPSSILGLTFTNKAAGEMKARVQNITNQQVLICTFHSLGARILREMIHLLDYRRDFTIYDDQDTEKLLKLCLGEMGALTTSDPKGFINAISAAKNALLPPEQDESKLKDSGDRVFAEVYRRYQTKLKESNAVDFDDLLYMPVQLFRQFPDVLKHYQHRWSYLLIDEYQDTNMAQYTIVRHLVASHNNLCVVGDPDQSIYSWRGANINNILGFEDDYPGAKIVRLEQNYRSRSNILEAANALISYNAGRYKKDLWSERGPGEKIKHFTADTERGEAEFIAEKIRHHYEKHNIPLKEMAVFYRTNAQSRALEDKMLLHRIPYVIVGGVSFYQRREIKDVLAFLRMIQSGSDFISFARTINIPKRGIGETTLEKIHSGASQEGLSVLGFCAAVVGDHPLKHPIKISGKQKEAIKSYLDVIHELKELNKASLLKELVKAAIEKTGYLDHLQSDKESYQERKENLNALVAKAAEWEESIAEPSLESFLEELSLKSNLDEVDNFQDRVHLMTMHNSKGLEFDLVFIAGLEEDLFPHANSREDPKGLEEERRLCYVGMTRAKEYLYLCDVRQRFLWGTTRSQRPSRFLREIPSEYIEKIRPTLFAKEYAYTPKAISKPSEDDFIDEMDQTVSEKEEGLPPGQAVFHKTFGLGVIRQTYQGSAGLTYKIFFSNDNRERTLVANLASLQKL